MICMRLAFLPDMCMVLTKRSAAANKQQRAVMQSMTKYFDMWTSPEEKLCKGMYFWEYVEGLAFSSVIRLRLPGLCG